MCGRFSFHTLDKLKKIMKLLGEDDPVNLSDNITPKKDICAVYNNFDNISAYRNMYWQLIPDFCDEFKSKYSMYNTRIENIFDKEFKRELILTKRCLIPANSYYEWKVEGNNRILYNFRVEGEDIIFLGGIYSIWQDALGLTERYSCSILTTEAVPKIKFIHNRMPLIIEPKNINGWLNINKTDEKIVVDMLEANRKKENIAYQKIAIQC